MDTNTHTNIASLSTLKLQKKGNKMQPVHDERKSERTHEVTEGL